MVGVRYMICHWAINRTDPQNLLSTTLDVPLQRARYGQGSSIFQESMLGLMVLKGEKGDLTVTSKGK